MDSLLPDIPIDSIEFMKAFNESLVGIGRHRRAGMFVFLYKHDLSWKVAYENAHKLIESHVERALEDSASSKLPHSDQDLPPDRYILLHEMAKKIRDPIELRYQILQVFLQARDTTSVLVGNTLFHLARNPQTWIELRRSALALALGSQPLMFETLKSLVFFKYILFETTRLQGPSGRVLRTALHKTVLPKGGGHDGKSPTSVEKDAVVVLNLCGPPSPTKTSGATMCKISNPSAGSAKDRFGNSSPFLVERGYVLRSSRSCHRRFTCLLDWREGLRGLRGLRGEMW